MANLINYLHVGIHDDSIVLKTMEDRESKTDVCVGKSKFESANWN